MHLDKVGVEVLHVLELAAAILTHGHDVADVIGRRDDRHLDVGLLGVLDVRGVGVVVRVVDAHHRAVGLVYLVDDARERGDKV